MVRGWRVVISSPLSLSTEILLFRSPARKWGLSAGRGLARHSSIVRGLVVVPSAELWTSLIPVVRWETSSYCHVVKCRCKHEFSYLFHASTHVTFNI